VQIREYRLWDYNIQISVVDGQTIEADQNQVDKNIGQGRVTSACKIVA